MKVAINGLGRIGRATLRVLLDTPELELVAVNDLISDENLVYLLRYDTVYGRLERSVGHENGHLVIDGKRYRLCHERDPAQLPWSELDVDLVFECTGVFTKEDDLQKHVDAGAKHVILSAPAKSDSIPTIVYGATRVENGHRELVSCASCTTNCIAPVMEILNRRLGIEKALMSTIHAYTATQDLVDGPSKQFRRGRAAAMNLVPTTTGAGDATRDAVPELPAEFNAVSLRAPVIVGSIADVVALVERETTVEEVNSLFQEEAGSERYRGILGVCTDPIVSSDIIGDPRASLVDLTLTQVVGGNLVRVMSWYDNEWGYANQMVRYAVSAARAPVPA
jgi:glyceraldehyde 3-phosphate dehydrogenase